LLLNMHPGKQEAYCGKTNLQTLSRPIFYSLAPIESAYLPNLQGI
jgi:hypothetical protein